MDKEQLAIYIGNKIKEYRKAKGMVQSELADIIGTTKNTISNYETGFRSPKKDTLFDLADALGVSIDDLFPSRSTTEYDVDGTDKQRTKLIKTYDQLQKHRQEVVLDTAETQLDKQKAEEYFEKNAMDMFTLDDYKNKVKTVTLDFYDDPASAGTGYYLENDNKSTVTLPLFAVPDRSDFVITIAGDSMEPEYHDKDYVFVQQTFDVFEGDIGIFVVDGESYIKELRDEGGKICLHSLNEEYEDRIIEESQYFRVVGKVIGRYADY